MSFTKRDLDWLHGKKAKFINGAFYFYFHVMHVKVCEWNFGMEGKNFLCQINVPETTVYSEAYAATMAEAIQKSIDSIVYQAKILKSLCDLNKEENEY
jgi:hypothetical protein